MATPTKPKRNYPGTFITLEGPEGAGKTTQVKLLSQKLDALGIAHVITRDPGGTPLGKQIRRILLTPGGTVSPMAELLLYQADRAQHVDELIMPALMEGKLVICDRFIDSTVAYQGYGRGIDMETIKTLNQMSTGGLLPELTILFDLESEKGLGRLHPGGHDRLEREAIEFHHKVRQGYLKLAEEEPHRFSIIDATKALSAVQEDLRRIIIEHFSDRFSIV
ncbi:MAG: dTMP kinase [Candidatus Melainabacteria bacterium]|jgi:dTMP kinase|uniref:Thymidylate kinase n=1 Tax=Candidatus Obscuribacter phosphatis TaxID=1906157 RepID=A0A8J7PEA6_9BACT|nr:dTMP kinase [Candidatus Obscuribacter phosphatis]MCA0312310.1 dTMP kinase [Candidatus Melainabacteria bacterium]OPZ89849.1 MAG: Thymidylate kinase [bacterium ADurb.Bin425]